MGVPEKIDAAIRDFDAVITERIKYHRGVSDQKLGKLELRVAELEHTVNELKKASNSPGRGATQK